jgi:hypothetical protein
VGSVFLIGLYFSAALLMSHQKPLTYDEILTLNIAELPSLRQVWDALSYAGDANPPLYHLVAHLFIKLFGSSPQTLRAPSAFAFFVMAILFYKFVADRLGKAAGALAMLLLFAQFYYATEARPYSFIMLFAVVALGAWSRVGEHKFRRRSLVLLATSFFLGYSSHYYFCIVAGVFGIAELFRSWERRHMDWPTLLIISFSPISYLPYLPMIQYARTYLQNFWSPYNKADLVKAFAGVLGGFQIVGLLSMLFVTSYLLGEKASGKYTEDSRNFTKTEIGALLSFCLAPILLFVIALFTNAFVPRYALVALFGFSAIFAKFSKDFWGNSVVRRVLVFALVIFCLMVQMESEYRLEGQAKTALLSNCDVIDSLAESGAMLVVPLGERYMQLYNICGPKNHKHLVFPADQETELKYIKNDGFFWAVTAQSRIVRDSIVMTPEEILEKKKDFFVLGPEWINDAILQNSVNLRREVIQPDALTKYSFTTIANGSTN